MPREDPMDMEWSKTKMAPLLKRDLETDKPVVKGSSGLERIGIMLETFWITLLMAGVNMCRLTYLMLANSRATPFTARVNWKLTKMMASSLGLWKTAKWKKADSPGKSIPKPPIKSSDFNTMAHFSTTNSTATIAPLSQTQAFTKAVSEKARKKVPVVFSSDKSTNT